MHVVQQFMNMIMQFLFIQACTHFYSPGKENLVGQGNFNCEIIYGIHFSFVSLIRIPLVIISISHKRSLFANISLDNLQLYCYLLQKTKMIFTTFEVYDCFVANLIYH